MTPRSDTGGESMDPAAVDRFLEEQGVGVLSLADDGDAYGIPLSYGYDADSRTLYFVLLRTGEQGRKEDYLETTDLATFTVHWVASPGEWRSVVARGPMRPVADEEQQRAVEAVDTNAWYPSLFRESRPMRGIAGWALEIEELNGLRGG